MSVWQRHSILPGLILDSRLQSESAASATRQVKIKLLVMVQQVNLLPIPIIITECVYLINCWWSEHVFYHRVYEPGINTQLRKKWALSSALEALTSRAQLFFAPRFIDSTPRARYNCNLFFENGTRKFQLSKIAWTQILFLVVFPLTTHVTILKGQ